MMKTAGLIIELIGNTHRVVQISKTTGYLGRNKEDRNIILEGNQPIRFDPVTNIS